MQTIAHSLLTFVSPRRRNCRNPLACFICPNTGSTTCLRSRYRLRRPALRIVSAIACIRGLRFSTRPAVGSVSPCLDTTRRQVDRDPAIIHGVQVGFGGEPGVARHLPQLAAEVRTRLVDKRDEGSEIGRVGAQLLGDDDLVGGIDRNLTVVAGDEPALVGHDPAVPVGEVTLRPIGRRGVRRRVRGPVFARTTLLHARGRAGAIGIGRLPGPALASASSCALAARIRARRRCLSAIQAGVSSPR